MSKEKIERAVCLSDDLDLSPTYFEKFHDTSISISMEDTVFVKGNYENDSMYPGKIIILRLTNDNVPGTDHDPPLKYWEIVTGEEPR